MRRLAGLGDLPVAAPSDVRVASFDDAHTTADVTWADHADNERGCHVQKSTDGGTTWTTAATTGPNQTHAVLEGLDPNQTVQVRVVAYDGGTNTAPTTAAALHPGPLDAAVPSGFALVDSFTIDSERMASQVPVGLQRSRFALKSGYTYYVEVLGSPLIAKHENRVGDAEFQQIPNDPHWLDQFGPDWLSTDTGVRLSGVQWAGKWNSKSGTLYGRALDGKYLQPVVGTGSPLAAFYQDVPQTPWYADNSGLFAMKIYVSVDLDIDGDNTNGYDDPDRSTAEENLEDSTSSSKTVPPSISDMDNDKVVDFADFDGVGDAESGLHFVPVILELPFDTDADLDSSFVRFEYESSAPFGDAISRTGSGTTDDPYMHVAAAGRYRIWKKDGFEARSAVDYVEGGKTYTAKELGFEAGKPLKLYVEAVRRLPGAAAIRAMVVQTPSFSNSPFVAFDDVYSTSLVPKTQATFSFQAFIPNSVGDPAHANLGPLYEGENWQVEPEGFPEWTTLTDFPEGYQGAGPQSATVFSTDNRASANEVGSSRLETFLLTGLTPDKIGTLAGAGAGLLKTSVGTSSQATMQYVWGVRPGYWVGKKQLHHSIDRSYRASNPQ